jgi:superfamily I DNA and/or RNA helicase
MNEKQIQKLCLTGTDVYLKFLEENKRAVDRINVLIKEQFPSPHVSMFRLILAKQLFDRDNISIELKPPGKIYGPDHFSVEEYDADTKTLIIEVLKSDLNLRHSAATNITVISDLRFLVKNVRKWYATNGLKIQHPVMPAIAARRLTAAKYSNCEEALDSFQKQAVITSVTNPLAYIWGPPGTGKTRHVLTHAVTTLLRRHKKIAIFAPTNLALDQAMEAVIIAARSEEIRGDESFLRLGVPSTKFAKLFPSACEIQSLNKRMTDLKRQIEIYEAVLNHRRGATILKSVDLLKFEIDGLQNQLRERQNIYEELGTKRGNLISRAAHRFKGKRKGQETSLELLETQINARLEKVKRLHTESQKLDILLAQIDFTNIDKVEGEIIILEKKINRYMASRGALAKEYANRSSDDIEKVRQNLVDQISTLESQTVKERLKSASVIGMTLDYFIGHFVDTRIKADHIFVDEAGYAPLVKVLTLCRGEIPLTLIGDHMQLGPVCQMDTNNIRTEADKSACVWMSSALHVGDVLISQRQGPLIARLLSQNEPKPKSIIWAKLKTTYRFGQNLADILSKNVYRKNELLSAENQGLQDIKVHCIDAPPFSNPKLNRQNIAEVEQIEKLLNTCTFDSDKDESYAILTPYKDQVALLSKRLIVPQQQGRIMTIHRSQGREWDTVILSIVDGRLREPWFTNTTNAKSGGMYVMNTAISRARKHLIIVCDLNHWLKQDSKQLISELLRSKDIIFHTF